VDLISYSNFNKHFTAKEDLAGFSSRIVSPAAFAGSCQTTYNYFELRKT
jgi:hypothetical protein